MQELAIDEPDPTETVMTFPEGDQASIQNLYEQKLQITEQRLREAERLAKMGFWELDFAADRLHWSAETFRILELDPLDFEPSLEVFFRLVHPNDREHVEKQFGDAVANHTQYNVFHRLVLPSGKIKFVNERCRIFYDNSRYPVRAMGTMLDMTNHEREVEKLMRAEAGLEIYAKGLEAEIEELSSQLERERKELAQARELIQMLSDNLRLAGGAEVYDLRFGMPAAGRGASSMAAGAG